VDVPGETDAGVAAVQAVAALEDPSRRELYWFIRASAQPVTREQAAAAIGISRKLAAFHLDKLVDAGLLVAAYDRAARTRTRGRAPKAYRPADVQVSISIPERQPAALAELLIAAVLTAGPDETAREAVLRIAEEHGRALGDDARAALARDDSALSAPSLSPRAPCAHGATSRSGCRPPACGCETARSNRWPTRPPTWSAA
jgi:predicted ArsR family transcriptional regulator